MVNVYKCKEIDLRGRVVEAIYRAESKGEIEQMIRSKGHTPVRIEVEEEKGKDVGELDIFQPKVKTKDLAVFCKQMHTMLNAGMPLITALDVMANQSDNKTLKTTVRQMATDVQKGDVLSTAMKRHKKVFPDLLVGMIESGELTGNLDNVLDRMSEHYTKENKINAKIRGAMIYPLILSIVATVVVVFLLTFILPTFTGMIVASGGTIPLPTRILLAISDAIKGYWYLFIAGIAILVIAFKGVTATVDGRRVVDKIKLSIPIIKVSIAKIATSRFTRTLATLLASGIPILQALETSASVTGNQVVIDGIGQVSEDIKKGASLSLLLKRVGVFPPMMVSMVGIGEESGALEEMLDKTADYYDAELDEAIQRMISVLEPAMIVVMALIVGFIVISMLLPMFDMYSTIA